MLPRDKGEYETRLAGYRRPADEPEDFIIGYSLIAATIIVGVALAIIFAAL